MWRPRASRRSYGSPPIRSSSAKPSSRTRKATSSPTCSSVSRSRSTATPWRQNPERSSRSTAEVKQVKLSATLFLTLTNTHHAALTVTWSGIQRPFSRFGPFELELIQSRFNQGRWGTVWEFLLWGMHHIFIGYDHIAFLLALLLAARKLRAMLKIVTSFTVAHSLTLL